MNPWTILCFGTHFGVPTVELHGAFASDTAAQEAIDLQEFSTLYKAVQAWVTPSSSGAPTVPLSLSAGMWLVVISSVDAAGAAAFFVYGSFASEAEGMAWIAGQGGRAGMSVVQLEAFP